jgi:hypothetical protein
VSSEDKVRIQGQRDKETKRLSDRETEGLKGVGLGLGILRIKNSGARSEGSELRIF